MAPAPSTPSDPERERLAAQVDADPATPASYLALAAYLRATGDPRGELIEIMHARDADAEASDRERALIQEIGPRYPGEARLGWRWGFAAEAEVFISEGDDRAVRRFLEHPSLRHLQVLDLHAGTMSEDELTDYIVPVIAERPRPCLRHLYVAQITQDEHANPPRATIDFTALWPAAPGLAELFATARRITIGAPTATALVEASFDGQVTGADAAAMIEASRSLRSLELIDLVDAAPLWARLARFEHLAAMEQLSIAGAALDDAAVGHVLAAAAQLAPIAKLVLPAAGAPAQAAVRARLPAVTFAKPRDPTRYDAVDPESD